MRWFPACIFALALSSMAAGATEDARLDYRIKVRLKGQPDVLESGFRVLATAPLVTRNHKQRRRLGSWEILPLAGKGAAPSPALLVQALNLCYFSGPTAEAVPLATGMQFAGHWCRLWQVRIPPQVGAYAYLAEVAPGLLALAYFSAALPGGSVRSLEVHLAGVALGPRTVPAEEGTALLRTLQAWAFAPAPPAGEEPGALETESVP